MTGTATEIVDLLIARAREGIDAGKTVSINAVGTRGWVAISGISLANRDMSLLTFTGRFGENEGAIFYIPADALLAVRVADERFT